MSATSSLEDKLVISKAKDTMYLADKRHCACFYGFLNEHESHLISDNLHMDDNCGFWGGYEGAKRVMFSVNAESYSDYPFLCAQFSFNKNYELSHRDFLGALMSLGIERSTIGDILVFEGRALIFIKEEIFEYVKNEITKIGRVGVQLSVYEGNEIQFTDDFELITFTLSSFRLDSFVSAVCHLSRDKSQNLIKSDFVSVNYNIVNNVSKNLNLGDIITIRKYGKFEFTEESGVSKKGRARVSVKHFR